MSSVAEPANNGVVHPTPSVLDVLTLDQAAAYLQRPADVVRHEAEARRLLGRLVDSDWRFVREDVIRWVRTAVDAHDRGKASQAYQSRWNEDTAQLAEAEIAELRTIRKSWGKVGDLPGEGEADE